MKSFPSRIQVTTLIPKSGLAQYDHSIANPQIAENLALSPLPTRLSSTSSGIFVGFDEEPGQSSSASDVAAAAAASRCRTQWSGASSTLQKDTRGVLSIKELEDPLGVRCD